MRTWLMERRKLMRLTQKEVADMAHMSQPSYYAIEAGKSTPRPMAAKRIAAALRFDWTKFYDDPSEEE